MGTRAMASIIDTLFEKSVLYVISPYDAVAHVCQALIGTEMTYNHPWVWSLISVIVINGLALYLLANRVSSLEVLGMMPDISQHGSSESQEWKPVENTPVILFDRFPNHTVKSTQWVVFH